MDLAIANLTSIPVLIFLLAVLASRVSKTITIPDSIYQGIAIFLLLGIGLKGGHAIRNSDLASLALPALAALALGIVIPIIAYLLLTLTKKFSKVDRANLAAHYGSTSLVTFTAALVMLESLKIFVEPYMAALLAIMEIPGIIIGIYLGMRGEKQTESLGELIKEIFFGKTVFLLVAGLIVGSVAPESSYEKAMPFFVTLQPGILALFLLQLGVVAGSKLQSLRQSGWWLPIFGIAMPVVTGALGAAVGIAIGLSVGGATILATLCASASYIAAPAAVSIAMPKANLSLSLTASLGITFPFNLIFGLPLYLSLANYFTQVV